MSASEQLESRSVSWDQSGKLRGTRVWLVEGDPPAAKQDPELPATHSGFPGFDTELFLDRYEAILFNAAQPNVTSKVTAYYSDDESETFGASRPPDPTDPFFASWSVDRRDYDQSIPFVQLNPAKYSYTDVRQNPPVERQIVGYDEGEEIHIEGRTTISRRVVITGLFAMAQIEQIENLAGSIVQIGTKFWRFTPGPINETARNRWETAYTFERDPGTPDVFINTPNLTFPKNIISVLPGATIPGVYARPPYHKVVLQPGTYDAGPPPFIGPPRFVAMPLYPVVALTGHTQLPGWR